MTEIVLKNMLDEEARDKFLNRVRAVLYPTGLISIAVMAALTVKILLQ
jgi:hypothetical protein